MSMETQVAIATKVLEQRNKNNIFVEANVSKNSDKFQLYPLHSFWGVDFWLFVVVFFFANFAFLLP